MSNLLVVGYFPYGSLSGIARGATTDIRMDALQGKKLQQLSDDPVSFEITYHGEHTCQLSLENPPVPSSLPELEIAQGDWQPKKRESALKYLKIYD